jgi:subtilisin family serine protease
MQMKSSKDFVPQPSRSKAGVCAVLILALFTVYVQPGFALAPPAPKANAQLLGGLLGGLGLLPTQRYIVRDTRGLLGLNLTCLLFRCQVLQGIGDPDGQLFVVSAASLLSPLLFLTQLLSGAGITNAEIDQSVDTQGTTTVGATPDYLTDRTPVSYYGATVWEGYVLQTPNQIINTSSTQSAYGVTGQGITVAIIDTGVDPNNSILKSHLVNGYDFTRNKSGGSEMADVTQSTVGVLDGSRTQPAQVNQSTVGVLDQSTVGVLDTSKYAAFGHGTMTAGIVHLVAPQANIMPLKSFNATGTGYASDVLRAIYYAVNHGAKVISMSFDFTTPSKELANAINYATLRGVICVASAGNDGSMATVYPASLPNVIDVASTSNDNTPSSFSNYGTPPVMLSAPGEAVMTTYPYNTYAAGWGTSFSAPLVSGTVALMADVNSTLLNEQQAAKALSHAQPLPYSQYGYGVLDTNQAVQAWRNVLGVWW